MLWDPLTTPTRSWNLYLQQTTRWPRPLDFYPLLGFFQDLRRKQHFPLYFSREFSKTLFVPPASLESIRCDIIWPRSAVDETYTQNKLKRYQNHLIFIPGWVSLGSQPKSTHSTFYFSKELSKDAFFPPASLESIRCDIHWPRSPVGETYT